jgi:hypothetical protein
LRAFVLDNKIVGFSIAQKRCCNNELVIEMLGNNGITEGFIDPFKFGIKCPIVESDLFNNRMALDIIIGSIEV